MTDFRIPLNINRKGQGNEQERVGTLARTFSNDAGLTSEKQIRKTS